MGEQVTFAKVRMSFTDTVKSISGRERTGHLHPTLQPLLRLPEFLQFREVLVEDEHFGEAERRCHRRRRRRHRRGANLRPPPRLRRRRHHHRSPHHRGKQSLHVKPRAAGQQQEWSSRFLWHSLMNETLPPNSMS